MPGSGRTKSLRIGEWQFEPSLNRLSREGEQVELEPMASRLLEEMAARPSVVLSVDELIEAVWDSRIVSDNPVYKLVANLRRTLDDDPGKPRYIETIRKRGYRLIALVTEIESAHHEDPVTTAPFPPANRPLFSWPPILAIIVALVALGWAATTQFRDSAPTSTPATPVLAVLPFEDMSESSNQEYLGRGIAEEIIHVLSNQKRYGVVGRTSSFAVAAQTGDLRRIGELLGASHVVEGSVRTTDDKLRVTAQLIDTRSGLHVWSRNFDRPYSEILAIQTDIAELVLAAITESIDEKPVDIVAEQTATGQLDAYESYLRGRNWLSQRGSVAAANAEREFLAALSVDAQLVQAMEGLVEAQYVLNFHGVKAAQDAYAIAEVYAERALAIAPKRAEVHAALGRLAELGARQGDAEQAYRTALEFDPANSEALGALAWLLFSQLRFDEALPVFDKALQVEPASPLLSVAAAMNTEHLGDYSCAGKLFERAVEIAPSMTNAQWGLGSHRWRAYRDLEGASVRMQRAAQIDSTSSNPPAFLVMIMLDAGDPESAADWLEQPGDTGYDGFWASIARLAHSTYTGRIETATSTANLLASYSAEPLALRHLRDQAISAGRFEDAIATYPAELHDGASGVTPANIRLIADLAFAYAAAGDQLRAETLATSVLEATARIPRKAWRGYWLADVVAANIVSGPEAALDRLQNAIDGGWHALSWWELDRNSALDELRALPRYDELVEKLHRNGLVASVDEVHPDKKLGFCARIDDALRR